MNDAEAAQFSAACIRKLSSEWRDVANYQHIAWDATGDSKRVS
jgi:hypothetical protein